MMTQQAIVDFGNKTICICFSKDDGQTEECGGQFPFIQKQIEKRESIPTNLQNLIFGTKSIHNEEQFKQILKETANSSPIFLKLHLKGGLQGGKGGFGALLRGSGGKPGVKRGTSNYDNCRDLSGKRIRTVKNEVRLKLWYEEQKMKEMKPKQPEPHRIAADDKYKRNLSEFINKVRKIEETISSSVEIGLQKALEKKKQMQEEAQDSSE